MTDTLTEGAEVKVGMPVAFSLDPSVSEMPLEVAPLEGGSSLISGHSLESPYSHTQGRLRAHDQGTVDSEVSAKATELLKQESHIESKRHRKFLLQEDIRKEFQAERGIANKGEDKRNLGFCRASLGSGRGEQAIVWAKGESMEHGNT
ncbi:hypothetical protein STEG23_013938 [Scotinomys teguina]